MVFLGILLALPLLNTAQAKINPKGLNLIKRCICGDRTYHQLAISRAIMAASEGRRPGVQYPAPFFNTEGFPFPKCNSAQIFEYPLAKRDNFAAGDLPGKDRVIYDSDYRFCSCITHPVGQTDFVECQVETRARKKKKKKERLKGSTSGTSPPVTPANEPVAK